MTDMDTCRHCGRDMTSIPEHYKDMGWHELLAHTDRLLTESERHSDRYQQILDDIREATDG